MFIFVQLALARWLSFGSAVILFGSSLFAFYGSTCAAAAFTTKRQLQLTVVALGSAIVWAADSIVLVSDDPSGLFNSDIVSSFFMETSFGRIWLGRFVLLMAMVGVASSGRRVRSSKRFQPIVMTLLSGALLASQAWLGHAVAGQGAYGWVQIAAYAIHVLAAGAWLGGLFPLARTLACSRNDRGSDLVDATLRRFSAMGMASVILIVTSGIASAVFRLASFRALLTTPYGLMIVAKAALLTIMIIIALINRVHLMPEIRRSDLRAGADRAALRRNVIAEQTLGALVLAAAAILGMLSPSGS
jgi:putative copper resistance protein D